MAYIRITHGKMVDGFLCQKCDARREGKLIRERFRWWVNLICGHKKFLGYTCSHERRVALGIDKKKVQEKV